MKLFVPLLFRSLVQWLQADPYAAVAALAGVALLVVVGSLAYGWWAESRRSK